MVVSLNSRLASSPREASALRGSSRAEGLGPRAEDPGLRAEGSGLRAEG